jgi:hypothetical protein
VPAGQLDESAGQGASNVALSPLRAALMATKRLMEERQYSRALSGTEEHAVAEGTMTEVSRIEEPPTGQSDQFTSTSTAGISPAERPSAEGNVLVDNEERPVDEPANHVANRELSLHASPSDTAVVVAVIGRGRVLREIDRSRGWVRVEAADDSSRSPAGWIHGKLWRAQQVQP